MFSKRSITTLVIAAFLALFVIARTGVAQVDEELVLYLPFDEGQGQVAQDESNSGLRANLDGPKWVDGRFGKALELDGVDDIITLNDADELKLLDGGTIMAWIYIKTASGHASWPRIMIKSETNGGTGTGYDFLLDRALGYSLRFCTGGACNTMDSPPETDTWQHIAITFDGDTIRGYIEGQEIGNIAQPGPTTDSAGQKAGIGNSPVDARQFHGLMDEVRVWSRALTEAEIQEQMELGADDLLAVEPQGKLAITWGALKRD